jgi:hypothetical protein
MNQTRQPVPGVRGGNVAPLADGGKNDPGPQDLHQLGAGGTMVALKRTVDGILPATADTHKRRGTKEPRPPHS